jgi:hypothetical protein
MGFCFVVNYSPILDHEPAAKQANNPVVPTPFREGVRSFRSDSFFCWVELGLKERDETMVVDYFQLWHPLSSIPLLA